MAVLMDATYSGFTPALTARSCTCLASSPLTSTASRHPGFFKLKEAKLLLLCNTSLGCSSGAQMPLGRVSAVAQTSQVNERYASLSSASSVLDPELHSVLELASEAELCELSEILYGRSIFSPILKSVLPGKSIDYDNVPVQNLEGSRGRDALLRHLELRFLFLAADAKATLSGRKPMYREVLLLVRKKLDVPCSQNLATEDLEAEIFLHLLQQYSGARMKSRSSSNKLQASYINDVGSARARNWPGYSFAALRLGIDELCSALLKGGGAMTMSTLQRILSKELYGKMLVECARYRMSKETLVKCGYLVSSRLESHVTMLSARQGFFGAASRYVALRSMMAYVAPVLWGLFVADLAISAVGTDYARVIRAIFTFAQIRLTRTYGWTTSDTLRKVKSL